MTRYRYLWWSTAGIFSILANVTALAQANPGPNVDVTQPQRALDRLQAGHQRTHAPTLAAAAEEPSQLDTKPLFKLRSVVLRGAGSLPSTSLQDIYASFINKDVSAADLSTITTAITEHYRIAGWHLTRAIIRPQNADGGRLVITIIEGRIAEVRVRGNAAKNQALNEILAPIKHEKHSRRDTVERRLLLASDLPGVRIAETSLEEVGTASGRFRLIVDAESWNNYTSITVDNRGTNAVGPYQSYLATNFNSVFKAGDTLGAAFSTATDLKELKFGRFSYSTPIGLDGARVSIVAAHSSVKPGDFRREFNTNVRADFVEIRGTIAPLRTQTSSLWLSGAASVGEYSERDVFGKIYADHLRIISGTADYQTKDSLGGRNYLTMNAKLGLPILGATRADDPLSSRGISAEFAKVEGYYSRIQTLSGPWSLKLAAATQLASGPLLLSQQFYLGAAFGRGFFGLEYSRDNAAAGSVELRYDHSLSWNFLNGYQIYGYLDHTSIWNIRDDARALTLSLAGAGVRFYLPSALQANIEVALPIDYSTQISLSERPRFFFGLSKTFKFCPENSRLSCS